MTAKHDRKFFDTFMLVLGVLIAIAVVLYVLGRIAGTSQERSINADARVQAAINDRIAPVARLAVAGENNAALAAAPKEAAPPADLPGEEVYNKACIACHGAGVGGAPKFSDKSAWGSRIAKGAETLHKHALEGFQGTAGFMPPKGGAITMTDKSITNAVDYMVGAVK